MNEAKRWVGKMQDDSYAMDKKKKTSGFINWREKWWNLDIVTLKNNSLLFETKKMLIYRKRNEKKKYKRQALTL